jgi:hypothetical protein
MDAVKPHQHPEAPAAAVREAHLVARHEVRVVQAHLRSRRIPPFRHRPDPFHFGVHPPVSAQPWGSPAHGAAEATGSVARAAPAGHGAIPYTTSRGTA